MKTVLAHSSHLLFFGGLVYILLYTFLPGVIPTWLSFSPHVSILILFLWAAHAPYYLNRFTKK